MNFSASNNQEDEMSIKANQNWCKIANIVLNHEIRNSANLKKKPTILAVSLTGNIYEKVQGNANSSKTKSNKTKISFKRRTNKHASIQSSCSYHNNLNREKHEVHF